MKDKDDFRLVACNRDGSLVTPIGALPEPIAEACAATAGLYEQVGYEPPWIGYVAVIGDTAVGGCAFVGPPLNNRVEIAYFTLPERQGEGIAGRSARHLVSIARAALPEVEISAKTMPEPNASTRILERLGFRLIGTAQDDEIGTAWMWVLG